LWDDFGGHWTADVLEYAASLNVILLKVPPKYTYVCRLADVFWNKPFKTALRKRWVDRLRNELYQEEPFKVTAPNRVDITQWVVSCWNDLTTETIIGGFARVGI
ncbi:hypothetical protein PHYSODRAFT_402701, partial [Phytophthora sojae]